jgi:UDP-glucuronate decarboxylase
MLELAREKNARIIQASTSEVYGDPNISPQVETYWGNVNPIGIRACYDEGKRASEALFFDYNRQFNLDIKIARIFNTYGPKMALNDGRVVSNFIVQALQNMPITMYGDGLQTRSFCYVDDLIDGFISFMDVPAGEHGMPGFPGPINLGNPVEFTMLELAQLVIKLTNSKSKLVHMPLPADDPLQRKPDITLARQHLQWEPKVQLETGLSKTIHYFDTLLSE